MCSNNQTPHIEQSRYDQDSYWGRVQTYFEQHNPLHIFRTSSQIEEARCLYLKCRCGQPLPDDLDEEELWNAKTLYQSAYNPHTGAKIPFILRPGTQVPVNALLAGGMMAYYSSALGVIFWQCLNQTYNAFVTATNKTGTDAFTDQQLNISYALATGTAVGTALGLNAILRNSSPFVRRLAPLGAVAAAHCVSVPLLRAQMLKNGAPIYDDSNCKLGYSKMAAQASIGGVVFHKVGIALPPMVLTPFVIHHYVEPRGTLCRYPWMNFPIHAAMAFLFLALVSPLVCGCCEQKGLLPFKYLEPNLQGLLCKKFYERPPKYVYYDRNLY